MDIDTLALKIGQTLKQQGWTLATAESCTGGWVAQAVTSVSGSSQWFDRGFITYTDLSKQELLGVSADVLSWHGAVSEQTARVMAEGALGRSHAQVALAITGIAGPTGGTTLKPVGTVWFAWAATNKSTVSSLRIFTGDRQAVRGQAVIVALEGLLQFVGT